MPPKKKNTKMALADFFAETTGSSWADEIDTLPTAPAARDDMGPRRGEPGYLDSMPDRGARSFGGAPPMREDVPLPTVPPFTAFVGNLTFETEEAELRDFFADLSPTSVRMVKDPMTQKPKGFGYVEFSSQQGLKDALDRSGINLAGRTVRINIADTPASGRRDFAPSAADEASQWRRSTPLPARDPPRRTFSGASGGEGGGDRDWSAARGSKFTPSRESSGYGRPREDMPAGMADEAGNWRSNKPMATPVAAAPRGHPGAPGGPGMGREAPPHRPAGPADTEATWSRGTRAPAPSTAPAERQRLVLQPRGSAAASPESTPAPAAKASPFGGARPVDTHTREVEAEQHAEARRKEASAAREAQAKAKAEREDKAKKAAEAEREARPKKVHPSRMGKEEPKSPKPAAVAAEADDDGFEAVRGPRAAAVEERKEAPKAKPATTKAGFSFAAAAGAVDVDVEDVTDKVADVSV